MHSLSFLSHAIIALASSASAFTPLSDSPSWHLLNNKNHQTIVSSVLHNRNQHPTYTYPRRRPHTHTESTNLFASSKQGEKGMTTLHFTGKKTFQSEPIPLQREEAETQTNLQDFFRQDQVRKLLLSGSDNNTPVFLSRQECVSLEKEWQEQSRIVGGFDPDLDKGDIVCEVDTGGMNFAGLNVKSVAMIGTKLIMPPAPDASSSAVNREDGAGRNIMSPEYQLVFIKDQQNVKGPMFLVWIFNKLTGKEGKEGESKEQAVTSFSRFYAMVTKDDKGESSVIFTIDTFLDIAVKFPSLLLKILPVSKEKAEEQGSASIVKTLNTDTSASLGRIVEYYRSMQ